MGVWIVVGEREPIALALGRLKKQLYYHGVTWEMRRRLYFADETQARRAKSFQKRLKSRKATLRAQIARVQAVASLICAEAAVRKRTGKP